MVSRLSKTLGIWIDFSEAGPRGNGQVHCNPSRWVSSESIQPYSLSPGWVPQQLLDPTLMTPGLRPGIGRSALRLKGPAITPAFRSHTPSSLRPLQRHNWASWLHVPAVNRASLQLLGLLYLLFRIFLTSSQPTECRSL